VTKDVQAGISTCTKGLERREKRVCELSNSVNDMHSTFEDKRREEEKAVTSMAQLETVLNDEIEKVIK